MAIEERVIRACQKAAMDHLGDPDSDAVNNALADVKKALKLPKLPGWIVDLVDNALREQIHMARHRANLKKKKAAGLYGTSGKVGASLALGDLAQSVWEENLYEFCICGRRLGGIHKDDLLGYAEIEHNKADGFYFNARLCEAAAAICKKRKGDTVEECMSQEELRKLFKTLQQKGDRVVA